MPAPGFVELTVAQQETTLFIAVDQIASFVAYDRYRPNYLSWVATKDGQRYQVTESPETIAELIRAAIAG